VPKAVKEPFTALEADVPKAVITQVRRTLAGNSGVKDVKGPFALNRI